MLARTASRAGARRQVAAAISLYSNTQCASTVSHIRFRPQISRILCNSYSTTVPSGTLLPRNATKNQCLRSFLSQRPFSSTPRSQNDRKPSDQPPGQSTGPSSSNQESQFSRQADSATRPSLDEIPDIKSNEAAPEQPPTRPLPDLRQGIPSTFEAEFLDKSESPKDEAKQPLSLNITEDPNEPQSESQERRQREQYVSSIDRKWQQMARYMTFGFLLFAAVGTAYMGRNWEEGEEKIRQDIPSGWGLKAFYDRVTARLSSQLGYYTEPAFPRLLPDQDPQLRMPYTLVLSLEDLLVHSSWSRTKGWEVAKRPGVDYFLRYMSAYYELVIFTSVAYMNADMIVRKLDPYRLVSFPLFREATRYKNGTHIKDLSYLNRDLSKTIIIDTLPEHVQDQPENAIILPKWDGTAQDQRGKDLVALIPFLEYIATMSIEDVREVLKSYEGKNIAEEFAAREQKAREAFNKRMEESKRGKPRSSGLGGLSSALGFKPASMMQIPGEQNPADAWAQGKMLSDQMRERGQRAYQDLDRQIREKGEEWLAEMEAEEKKMQQEAMQNMQSGFFSLPQKLFGFGGANEDQKDGGQQGESQNEKR